MYVCITSLPHKDNSKGLKSLDKKKRIGLHKLQPWCWGGRGRDRESPDLESGVATAKPEKIPIGQCESSAGKGAYTKPGDLGFISRTHVSVGGYDSMSCLLPSTWVMASDHKGEPQVPWLFTEQCTAGGWGMGSGEKWGQSLTSQEKQIRGAAAHQRCANCLLELPREAKHHQPALLWEQLLEVPRVGHCA